MSERFGAIDFDEFHCRDVPARLAAADPALRSAARRYRLRSLAFAVGGRAYTFSAGAEGVSVAPGDEQAETVVELDEADWTDFVWELRSCFALLYADRVTFRRGNFGQLARWEPVLRAVFDGQAIYDLEVPAPVLDADGCPIDLSRTFTLDDPDEAIADYLARAGFVHLRGVLDGDEVAALRADVEAAVARARPDDNKSWWTTVDGRDVCNRVNYLNEQSELIAGLGQDPRFLRVGSWGGPELREAADRLDGHGVVIKVPGASTGLADLPWHRDCGMGGHSVKCPMLNVGLQLDAATAGAGQLHVLAGSHRGTSPLPSDRQTEGLPVIALTTEPGDVTVHFGHTLHAAPPPADRAAAGRRALYLSYVPPLTFEMVGPGQGYNDVLFTRDAGHVHHVNELR